MKTAPLLTILLAALTLSVGSAQSVLQQKVTLIYSNERLGTVLDEISDKYAVNFAYSSHFIPLDEKVSVNARNESLSIALDEIFEPSGVVYAHIGGQIVLKKGNQPKKQEQLSQINTLPKSVKQTSPVHPPNEHERWLIEQMKRDREATITMLETQPIHEISGGTQATKIEQYQLTPIIIHEHETERMAQVSILPFIGTNMLQSAEVTNKLSLNVLWGVNGGVDGVEVGGFFNHIKNDVHGVQVAGFGNTVGGNTVGTQVSGLFNVNKGSVQGVQASGLFNVSGETDAVQVGGLFNVTRADFAGVQASGLFNVSKGKADGVQASSLFNIAGGKTKAQFSSLFNVAHDVEIAQISSLLNKGKNVKGLQIGLINIADSTSGVPIGLLNIIKNGYNRVEFSAGDALYANFALKLGARSFYNIFHFGARWDDITLTKMTPDSKEPIEESGTLMSWGLGYGFGTTIGFGPRTLMNIEAVTIHVNELEEWTEELNLLNQLRLLIDVRTGRHTSLFAGPVGSIMVSKLRRSDYNADGSMIAPYTFYNKTSPTNGSNVQMWVGFNAGVRF
ncbi:MAG: STN domain-containing protein [Saprospiraceae bacterium]|nr:STN domain-containing protein [Saprospiraceae bacterium]